VSVILRTLDAASEPAWDRFVQAMPGATFFHRAGWAKVIETAFGHATHFTFTERDGAITGVLPLGRVKTMLFGDTLISSPFCVYGGPVAADPESKAALIGHAERLLERTGAGALEFREPILSAAADGWIDGPDLYVTFRKTIGADHERNMKAIPRKQRAMVRKGIQNGLTSVANRDSDGLHRIYAESVRNLGTPVFARRFFRILMAVFGDAVDVVTILDKDTSIASVMNFSATAKRRGPASGGDRRRLRDWPGRRCSTVYRACNGRGGAHADRPRHPEQGARGHVVRQACRAHLRCARRNRGGARERGCSG
jgi:FemAB-related protein (PEP-CTERM system-associated)